MTASGLLKKKAKRKSEKRGERHKKHLSDGPNGALWARLLVQSILGRTDDLIKLQKR